MSASADDGKTTTSVNLAVAAARAGQRVILVDSDLRRPSVNGFLGLGRLRGLTDATLAGLAVPDALEVGRLVDGAVVVLQHEKSTRREIVAAVERLEQVGVPVLGTVMNAIRTGSDTYYYSYYHNSGYFDPDGHGPAGGNGNGSRAPVRGGRAPSR